MHSPSGVGSRHDGAPCHLVGRGADRGPRVRLRLLFLFLFAAALLAFAGFNLAASAQSLSPGGPVDFGGLPLGTTSTVITLEFSVPGSTIITVSSITPLTEGAPNQDFAVLPSPPSSSCLGTFTGPHVCSISLTFTPSALGLRIGELLIKDQSGNVTNHVPLRGAGLGPQMIVSPATAAALTLTGITPTGTKPTSTVYDGAGNLYVDDAGNNRILESNTSGNAIVLATIPPPAPSPSAPFSSIAIAGDGTLYVSWPGTAIIYKIPPGGSATPLTITGAALVNPTGLALDGYGYLYVADANPTNSQIVRIDIENGNVAAALTLSGLSPGLVGPQGLSVDASDNLYVADTGNNRIVEIDLHTGSGLTNSAIVLPTTPITLSNPSSVVVNAAGGLSITDTSDSRLVELPLTGSPYVITLLNPSAPPPDFALNTPVGVTLLPTGDLLVSDTMIGLVQVTRTASSIIFPTPTLVGTTDTADGDLALNVENTGSYPLTISGSGFPIISNDAFFTDSTGTCPNTTNGTNGTQIPVGEACTLEVGFKPTINGPNTGTLSVAASGNGNVSATVSLYGTGFHVLDHFVVVVSPSTVTPGEATTMTVTAINNDGTVDTTYTGTINLTCTDPACVLPTGAYTFTAGDNGTHVFSSTLTPPLNFNTLGVWTVTVTDTTFKPGTTYTGTSNPVTVVTTPAVTLASSVNPVILGSNTMLTATVSSPYGTPTGTVTFMDGSTVLGTVTLSASGVATLTVSFPTAGTHPLTVSYPGAGYFQAANSAVLNEIVQTLGTTLGLTSSVNPVNVGANTILTASITSTSGTPTGTITFLDGTTVLGTAPLSASGVATLTVSFSTAGTHPLTATYPATGPYDAATSPVVNETVQTLGTTLGLTSSVNPVNVNGNTVLTATASSTSGTPTGTITFLDGTTILGTASLNASGIATLTVSFSTPGTHPLTASYPATGAYAAATSGVVNENVQNFATTATLTSSANPVLISNSTVLTATISSPAGAPTGTVTFFDGTVSIGTATLNASGVATLNATFTTNGQHILTVSYAGNGLYQPATSAPLTQVVEDFSLALATGSQNSASIILGQSTQYNLIVSPIGANSLAAPVALTVTGLPSGGSGSFNPTGVAGGAGTTPIVLTVNAPPLTSSLRAPANPANPRRSAPAFLALLLLPTGFLLRRRRAVVRMLVLFVGLAAAVGLTGCLSNQATGYYGQIPQTYTLTVTGTSGTLTHTVLVTLTVE